MLNYNKTGLSIFDNAQIDFKLPKWQERIKKQREVSGSTNEHEITLPISRRRPSGGLSTGTFIIAPSNDPSPFPTMLLGSNNKTSTLKKAELFFDNLFNRKKIKALRDLQIKQAQKSNFSYGDGVAFVDGSITLSEFENGLQNDDPNKQIELSVSNFFASVKNSAEELVLVKERYDCYESILSHLKDSGQEALHENMCMDLEIHRAETQLFSTGFTKLITEANVIEFAAKATRSIRLDWVKNFTRCIPKRIIEQKKRLDELHIFDNYVVMHYDPNGTSTALTEEEKQKIEKDPILFGIIIGRQNLYYIGDWIDEYCNLTFEKVVEELGADVVNANDLSVNIKMDIHVKD